MLTVPYAELTLASSHNALMICALFPLLICYLDQTLQCHPRTFSMFKDSITQDNELVVAKLSTIVKANFSENGRATLSG